MSEVRDLTIRTAPWFIRVRLNIELDLLNKKAQEFKKLNTQLDTVVNKIAHSQFPAEIQLILDLTQTHEELYSAKHGSSARSVFNITGVNPGLFEGFEKNSSEVKMDLVRLKDLFFKIAKRVHPDKEGGDAELFGLAKFLYDGKDTEGLYLLWIAVIDGNALDLHDLLQRISFLQRRRDHIEMRIVKMEASKSWQVLQAVVSGNQDLAHKLVKDILFQRAKALASDIYGLDAK